MLTQSRTVFFSFGEENFISLRCSWGTSGAHGSKGWNRTVGVAVGVTAAVLGQQMWFLALRHHCAWGWRLGVLASCQTEDCWTPSICPQCLKSREWTMKGEYYRLIRRKIFLSLGLGVSVGIFCNQCPASFTSLSCWIDKKYLGVHGRMEGEGFRRFWMRHP